MRRTLVKATAILVACLAIACGAAYAYLRRSLPEIDGQTSVGGLSASIDIIRDADAIPHIFASNEPDALFGLGYVHAQDRLWQMEFQRRIGHGTPLGDLRRGRRPAGSLSSHGRIRTCRAVGLGPDAGRGEGAGERVRRGRECIHLDASRQRGFRPNSRSSASNPSHGRASTLSSG